MSKSNTPARRKADELFEAFLTAYHLGKLPHREDFLADCPASERERLSEAIAGFLFSYENYHACRVREEAVESAVERLQKIRRQKQVYAQAKIRANTEMWDRPVFQPLVRLTDVLFPGKQTEINPPRVAIMNRSTSGLAGHKIDKNTQSYIETSTCREAERLLSRVGITNAPIPLDQIAEQLCLLVQEAPLQDIEGCLVTDGEAGGILLNSTSDPRRKRYTLAHEIGHYILHRTRQSSFSDKESEILNPQSHLELEANSFASYLLLPPDMLPKTFGKSVPSFEDADAVSEEFDVSLLAVLRRLVSQSNYPSALISFNNERRHWFSFSPEVEGFNQLSSEVPKESAAYELLVTREVGICTRKVDSHVWFTDGKLSRDNRMVLEHSRRFATGHIYTILSVID